MQIITNKSQKELKEHGSYQFPILVSRECLSGYETGSFLWHWHPEVELTLITDGVIEYHVNGSVFILKEGQALFGNANSLHSGNMVEGQDCHYISVTFDPRLVYGYENSLIYEKYVMPVVRDGALCAVVFDGSQEWHGEMIELIRGIISAYDGQEDGYEMELTGKLLKFWQLLVLNVDRKKGISGKEQKDYERIREILRFIEKNYDKKLTVDQIAENVYMCTSQCSRLFKKYMKKTLFDFILEYRIERSLADLLDPGCSMAEAAAGAGFNDSNYYSKVFVRIKGCAPSVYRKKMRGR